TGLAGLLDDSEPLVRLEALKALGNMGPKARDQLPALVKTATADKEPAIRGTAILVIASMGNAALQAVPALQAIEADAKQPEGIRQAAKEAIEHITGKNKKAPIM